MKSITFKKGFTLIELLVVIAIIAILATVVLASLDKSRVKADNAIRNKLSVEYMTALEFYKNDNKQYPDTGTDHICIGSGWSGDGCEIGTTGASNTAINAAIDVVLNGPPTNDKPLLVGTSDWSGTIYTCDDCSQYGLRWYLEDGGTCARGATLTTVPIGDKNIIRCTAGSM